MRIRILLVCLMVVTAMGCATPQISEVRAEASFDADRQLGTGPFQVGPVNVWVRPQPEVEFLCKLRLPAVAKNKRVIGCYLADSRTIISVADPYVIMHEFRHHFEGRFHD